MPYNFGGIDDALRLTILKKGRAYSPDKFGLRKKIWKLIIDDVLLPYRNSIHQPAEDFFRQMVDFGFIKETKKANFFCLAVHFSPYNRQRVIS